MKTTIEKIAAARTMLGDDEKKSVACLAEDIERIVEGRLAKCLGLNGDQVAAIAARVRTELREQIDLAIYDQRTTDFRGVPAI